MVLVHSPQNELCRCSCFHIHIPTAQDAGRNAGALLELSELVAGSPAQV